MKKLLVGLLALGSISSFASCNIFVNGILSLHVNENISIEDISFTKNKNADYGLKKLTKNISTGKYDSFGEEITEVEERYELYRNGKIVDSTPFLKVDKYSTYEYDTNSKSVKYLELMLEKLALSCQ